MEAARGAADNLGRALIGLADFILEWLAATVAAQVFIETFIRRDFVGHLFPLIVHRLTPDGIVFRSVSVSASQSLYAW